MAFAYIRKYRATAKRQVQKDKGYSTMGNETGKIIAGELSMASPESVEHAPLILGANGQPARDDYQDIANAAKDADKRETPNRQTVNPYRSKAKRETSGEGKGKSPLHKYTKATLQAVAYDMFGASVNGQDGNPVYVSAMDKDSIAVLLIANDVGESEIDLALSPLWEGTESELQS